jgi:molybdate transport system substrate-binding protein
VAADGPKETVLVLAAASTTNALDEIRQQFTRETGIEVSASYAASSTLAQQIVHGAEADVFLSADQKWADFLAAKGLVTQRHDLLGNRLVVVAPANSAFKLTRAEDLATARIEHLALGDPAGVPAGRYAKQALTKLGIWDQLEAKVVAAEDVRHALAYVETGSAEAGIVYSTDAAISKKVKIVAEIPSHLTEPIRYPVAILRHGQGRASVAAFYRYLASPAAKKVFQKYGFVVLDEPETPSQPTK